MCKQARLEYFRYFFIINASAGTISFRQSVVFFLSFRGGDSVTSKAQWRTVFLVRSISFGDSERGLRATGHRDCDVMLCI